jgi:hypothetical protein
MTNVIRSLQVDTKAQASRTSVDAVPQPLKRRIALTTAAFSTAAGCWLVDVLIL